MKNLLEYYQSLLMKSYKNILAIPSSELELKNDTSKWSKKEIIGHLIDSAINNLQRFTEVQFKKQPFIINSYDQNELVKANYYQFEDAEALVQLWFYINKRILSVVSNLSTKELEFKVVLSDKKTESLEFLIKDYILHLEHHLNQIIDE